MLQTITIFFAKHKSFVTRIKFLKENYPSLSYIYDNDRGFERLYCFLNKIEQTPVCQTCQQQPVKFDTFLTGFKKYCSHRCAVSNPNTAKQREKTNLQKYGGKGALTSPQVRAKFANTMKKRFGVEHALQNFSVNQSVIQQNKNKTEEQKEEIQKKKKDTMFARYGVENMWHLPEFVEKLKTTNLNKYGVDWVQQDPTILAKRTLARHQNFIDILKDRFPNISPLIDVNQYTGINIHQGGSKYPWKCDICEHVFEDYISFSHSPMCPVCTPKDIQFNSSSELELYNFLKTFDLEFRMHEKQIIAPFELDFVFEQKKLAIEYCGLYWHSEKKVDKNYHKKKLKLCNEQGYRLITIFEDEWRNKKDIVQSRLQHALGLSNKSCGARQTNIKQITTKEYRSFLEQNHIQGFAGAKIKLGAFFNNQLVSVMSFGAYRKALGSSVKQDEYELIRFCSLGKIPGISSKLFKYFLQNYSPKKIISYCDLRWGTGTVYEKLGFELMRVTEPNYWYTRDGLNREHRFKYTKQNLIKLGFDPNQTELDIMSQLGYYKIWDCGHLLYIFKV